MNKKIRNKILICMIFILSFFIFNIYYAAVKYKEGLERLEFDNVFGLIALGSAGGYVHFLFVSIIAILVRLSKKIPQDYKKMIYTFPLFAFIISPILCSFIVGLCEDKGFFGL